MRNMTSYLKLFLRRHQLVTNLRHWILAGLGGAIGIGITGGLSVATGMPLLIAPFGASCVLLFSVPGSPLSQPANVIGGHMVSSIAGLIISLLFPGLWWATALAVGLAISAMAALRVTHPPAGADPVVISAELPGIAFLLMPVFVGALLLVVTAQIFHKLSGTQYPIPD